MDVAGRFRCDADKHGSHETAQQFWSEGESERDVGPPCMIVPWLVVVDKFLRPRRQSRRRLSDPSAPLASAPLACATLASAEFEGAGPPHSLQGCVSPLIRASIDEMAVVGLIVWHPLCCGLSGVMGFW